MQEDIRWKQRFQNFDKAFRRLQQGIRIFEKDPDNILMQAGLIQMFEFTFELSWKVLKDFLESEGFTVQSPKSTIRQAFQCGYINNVDDWLQALADRNLTVHTYDDNTAISIIKNISSQYIHLLKDMYDFLKQRL